LARAAIQIFDSPLAQISLQVTLIDLAQVNKMLPGIEDRYEQARIALDLAQLTKDVLWDRMAQHLLEEIRQPDADSPNQEIGN
jgi:hypothetical protein